MAITDLKIMSTANDISSLSDRPASDGLSAAQLKARFDYLVKLQIEHFNDLIDLLDSTGGAAAVKTSAITGITADNIQNALAGLKDYVDGVALAAGAVTSVNGAAGAVVLDASDVGALASSGGTLTGGLVVAGVQTEGTAQARNTVVLASGTTNFDAVANNTLILVKEA